MSPCRLMFMIVITATLLCHIAYCGPARALQALARAKIPRSIRAPFRNPEIMTARGFGKRSQLNKYKDTAIPWNYGKRDTKFLDDTSTIDADQIEQILNEQTIESFPVEWFANEMSSNPQLARNILHRFVDTDKDGMLTPHELLSVQSSQESTNDIY